MGSTLLLLNGPNLNLLGTREPEVYGTATLPFIEEQAQAYARGLGFELACFQSNHEGVLIDAIQQAAGVYAGIVYNPGAHTHYSYALHDAITSVDVPVVEVHLSDITQREEFRRVSVIAPACIGQIYGLGWEGYLRGIDALAEHLR